MRSACPGHGGGSSESAATVSSFGFLLEPWFVWSYCLFIAVIFAWFLRRLLRQTRDCLRDLTDLREQLPQRDSGSSAEDLRARFARDFEDYDDKAANVLKLPWREFVERLILPPPGSDEPIRNTREVSRDLNDRTIVFPRIESEIFRSVPNLLTGIGILGTFLGLAVGVGVASAGLTSANQARITEALGELLTGAALAFWTSVAGILLSMVFLLVQRVNSRRCHLALSRWVMALEDCLFRITAEDLARQTLEQARTSANELKTFNTELIFSIQNALEEQVGNPLSERMDRLLDSLDALRRDRATDTAAVLEEALQQFGGVLRAQTATAFEDLAVTVGRLDEALRASTEAHDRTGKQVRDTLSTALEAAQESQKASADAMAETVEQARSGLSDSLDDVLRRLQQFLGQVGTSMTDTIHESGRELRDAVASVSGDFVSALSSASTESAERITAAFGKMEAAAATLEAATRQNAAFLPEMEDFVARFEDLKQAVRDTHREIVACATPIRLAASDLTDATGQMTAAVESSAGLVARIESATADLRGHGEAMAESWSRHEVRFEGLDASLATVFEKMNDGLSGYSKQVLEFADELDRITADSIQKLAAATSELNQSIEDLLEGLPRAR